MDTKDTARLGGGAAQEDGDGPLRKKRKMADTTIVDSNASQPQIVAAVPVADAPEIDLKINCFDGKMFPLRVSAQAAVREVKRAIGEVIALVLLLGVRDA
jgi:hypothetical protein